jgi:hypothetical protein
MNSGKCGGPRSPGGAQDYIEGLDDENACTIHDLKERLALRITSSGRLSDWRIVMVVCPGSCGKIVVL